MPTVINNPATSDSDSHGVSWVVALLLIVALFFLLFYGLPALRNSGTFYSVPNQAQPAPQGGSEVNLNVPREIDINTNTNPNPQGQ